MFHAVYTRRIVCLLPLDGGRRVPEVPSLDDPVLRRIDVLLLLYMLDADLEAIFSEDEVSSSHALLGVVADLGRAEVDLVDDEGDAAEDREKDQERE